MIGIARDPRRRPGRRELLKLLGVSTVLLPFVPCLDRSAEAAGPDGGTAGFPRRLLLTFAPNGTIESQFWPTGTEQQFTFPSGCVTAPLAPFQSSLILAKGLTRSRQRGGGGPHETAMGCLWTGGSLVPNPAGMNGYEYSSAPSIDQIIASSIQPPTAFPTIALSVEHDEQVGGDLDPTTRYMTYSARGVPVLPDPDPYHVYQTLIAGGGLPAGDVALTLAQRKSAIDLVLGELARLQPKIGVEDRAKVDAHLTALRDIEQRLSAGPRPSCNSAPPPPGYESLLLDNDSFPALVKMQNDLVVAALRCDLTRIASVQWSRTFSMLRHTWLNGPGGAASAPPHHTNSHETTPDANTWQTLISGWYCAQFAYLLGQLAAVPEGGGTLLDNTLAVWAYDMNLGAGHVISPAIAVLAGGLGGAMITRPGGRFVDFAGKYDWTQMLVTIGQAMGATDVRAVGDLGLAGAIPGVARV
jgi:hypothetical protein